MTKTANGMKNQPRLISTSLKNGIERPVASGSGRQHEDPQRGRGRDRDLKQQFHAAGQAFAVAGA